MSEMLLLLIFFFTVEIPNFRENPMVDSNTDYMGEILSDERIAAIIDNAKQIATQWMEGLGLQLTEEFFMYEFENNGNDGDSADEAEAEETGGQESYSVDIDSEDLNISEVVNDIELICVDELDPMELVLEDTQHNPLAFEEVDPESLKLFKKHCAFIFQKLDVFESK